MCKTDRIFLFCVLGCTVLFAARSIRHSVPLLSSGTSPASAALGVAGQSRDVDMTKLKRLLDRRALSDREAEFYEPVAAPSRSGSDGEQNGESQMLELESDRTRQDR